MSQIDLATDTEIESMQMKNRLLQQVLERHAPRAVMINIACHMLSEYLGISKKQAYKELKTLAVNHGYGSHKGEDQ